MFPELQQEVGVHGENSCMHGENLQTPCRKTIQTQDLLADCTTVQPSLPTQTFQSKNVKATRQTKKKYLYVKKVTDNSLPWRTEHGDHEWCRLQYFAAEKGNALQRCYGSYDNDLKECQGSDAKNCCTKEAAVSNKPHGSADQQ